MQIEHAMDRNKGKPRLKRAKYFNIGLHNTKKKHTPTFYRKNISVEMNV